MQKANLYCPQEKVFFKDLLIYKPVLPGQNTRPNASTSKLEVEILAVDGEQALVLLPNLVANKENETAIVSIYDLD